MRLPYFGDRRKHQPGDGPVGQGTRAFPNEGNQGGPKAEPRATTFGGSASYPTTQHDWPQNSWWPNNTATEVIIPGDHSADRNEVLDTRFGLQSGPPPGRIGRTFYNRNLGVIGAGTGVPGATGFPYNLEWALIPHQYIPRAPMGIGPRRKSWDDNAAIPAIYAGNPRG